MSRRDRDFTPSRPRRDRDFKKLCLETVSRPRHVSRHYSSGLNANKLSLNYTKTKYLLINRSKINELNPSILMLKSKELKSTDVTQLNI